MNEWHKLHITDKTGREWFHVSASPMSTMSEINNLKRHLQSAKAQPELYSFLDVDTAIVMLDGLPYGNTQDIDADALLKELGL